MIKRLVDISSEELIFSARSFQYLLSNEQGRRRKKILVNGSPKTGTTWMLKLVDSIPGYREIGNFDGEIKKYESVQPGEVVHGHDWYTEDLARILHDENIQVILMMRDPRDQLISRVFHIRRGNTHAWSDRFMEIDLDTAIMLCIEGREGLPGTRTMIELTQSWLSSGFTLECIRYEDLLSEPGNEFRRVLGFLGIDIPNDLINLIITRNKFERLSAGRKFWQHPRKPGQIDPNSHFRKGVVGDWKNYLNESNKLSFKEVAGDKLIELGYESNLNW